MASLNKTVIGVRNVTHEGAPAFQISAEKELARTIMACLLWEDGFYESGASVADRISQLVKKVSPLKVMEMAVKARTEQHLRHVPLFLLAELERSVAKYPGKEKFAETLASVIQRPDELTEFLSLYWRGKAQNAKKTPPLTAQAKKGLALAFAKFDAYSLAKYNNTEKQFKLKDVFRLVHPTTPNKELWNTWLQLINGQLVSPDTWEVALSGGADKKETFTRLIGERKLGAMALLRNLRNMQQAGVDDKVIRRALTTAKADKVLPFRFISAARFAPKYEAELEQMMFQNLGGFPHLKGKTVLLVDGSGSMSSSVSSKSDITRMDAASGVAMLLREICEAVVVYRFDYTTKLVPSRRGFALREALGGPNGATYTGEAINTANKEGYDRLIVISDEQSHDQIPAPLTDKAYFINVASDKNGIGYGKYTHVDGWSESIINYIAAAEEESE